MSKRKILATRHSLTLRPIAPFNFDATLHKPDHFPTADNNWVPGIRWQTMLWQGIPLGLRIENMGTLDKPKVAVSVWTDKELDRRFLNSLRSEISYRYSFQLDLSDFNSRFRNDPQLGPVIEKWRGMRPMSYSSLYEGIIICVVLQNATVRRSVNMAQALFEKYGTLLSFDGKELYCFWPPERMGRAPEEELRALKVGYRARNIKRVTESFVKDGFDEFKLRAKTREEQRRALLDLYGIGPASVGYILFGSLHHLEELDHIPPWEQMIYSKLFFDAEPDELVSTERLMSLFESRFGGYKMLAVHYIWEDLFWKRKHEPVPWLENLIRL